MAFKTYVLLPHMNPANSNIYVRVNGNQRQVLDKLPIWEPYLKVTYQESDEEGGKSRTIRYKVGTDTIFQDEQIKLGIDANAKPTQQEYRDRRFINSVLTTNKPTLQKYLETYPGFEGFKGFCDDIPVRQYKLYDKGMETKGLHAATLKRLNSVNAIVAMDLEKSKEMLYLIYGADYIPSEEVQDNHLVLIDYYDDNSDAMDKLLERKVISKPEEAKILVGKAITAGILSFDKKEHQVSKKKGNTWIDIKEIPSTYSVEERQRHFEEFLASEDGAILKSDLEKDVNKKS